MDCCGVATCFIGWFRALYVAVNAVWVGEVRWCSLFLVLRRWVCGLGVLVCCVLVVPADLDFW